MINHPVFARRVGKGPDGKVILVTVVDASSIGMTDKDNDVFFIGSTDNNMYTNFNTAITLNKESKVSASSFVKTVSKALNTFVNDVKGNSINGILTEPLWFVKKSKSILEQMGG